MSMTLRHVGILVKDLDESVRQYRKQGFRPKGAIETLLVAKMVDQDDNVLELVQGNWSPHIAVNWWRDGSENLIETVEEVQTDD